MNLVTDALFGLGVWLVDHGFPLAGGFIGGILAIIVHERWQARRKKPNGS